ncbi:MFS transporter [Rhizobium ruizarguesonis]
MAASEFRRGWPALAAAMLGNAIGVHSLPPYTIGLFMGPLQREFGWERTSISAGITILTLCSAISAPLVGSAISRFGANFLIIFGLVCGAVGYLFLNLMGSSIMVFWALMAGMALLGSGCGPVTLSHLLVTAFEKRRGTALGVAMMGIGISGALAPPFLGRVIDMYGWRMGYFAVCCAMVVATPVMVCLQVANKTRFPTVVPVVKAVGVAIPWQDPVLWRLLASFFCVAVASGGAVVHYVPMLLDSGYESARATAAASFLGIALLAGRLFTGIVIDRIFAPTVACVVMLGSSLGFLVLFSLGPDWTLLVAILVGLTLGAELDLIAYLVSRYFPPVLYGRIVGILYSGFLFGVAFSPLVFALFRDVFGTYSPCLLWACGLLGIASVLFRGLPPFAGNAQAYGRRLRAA